MARSDSRITVCMQPNERKAFTAAAKAQRKLVSVYARELLLSATHYATPNADLTAQLGSIRARYADTMSSDMKRALDKILVDAAFSVFTEVNRDRG